MDIAIIDDLSECRKEIQNSLLRFFLKHYREEPLRIMEYSSGEEFLSVFQKETFDLIFIDQYMQGVSGIETAKRIRLSDDLVSLVFITTSRDHAIESYQVRASGYLLKPFSYIDFETTMTMLDIARLKNARSICVQDEKILLREILWCDIEGHYVQMHTQHRGILRYRIPFSTAAEKLLEYPQFLTCYKGCIVNLDQVERMNELDFSMINGEKVLFSKRDKKEIENYYHTYLFQKVREEELL